MSYSLLLENEALSTGCQECFPKWDSKAYVEQLKGFKDLKVPNHVYRLKKALYGLKQLQELGMRDLLLTVWKKSLRDEELIETCSYIGPRMSY